MHQKPCTCHACGEKPPRPCPPPRPDPCCRPSRPEGVLLQKIVCCERRTIPCLCTCLTLSGLECARPPLSLLSVRESGAQPSWTPPGEPDCAGRISLKVCIPVCAQVADSCGQRFTATAMVEAETCLRLPPSCAGFYSLFIVPCVRLICAEGCSDGPTFQVRLQIALDLYAVRPEPCMLRGPEPACPDLPLYPPHIRQDPPCWPQCPAGPGPCGWPGRG